METISKTFSIKSLLLHAVDSRVLLGLQRFAPFSQLEAKGDQADLADFLQIVFQYGRELRHGARLYRYAFEQTEPSASEGGLLPGVYFWRDCFFGGDSQPQVESFAYLWERHANDGACFRLWQSQGILMASRGELIARANRIEKAAIKSLWAIERVAEQFAPLPRLIKTQNLRTGAVSYTAISGRGGSGH